MRRVRLAILAAALLGSIGCGEDPGGEESPSAMGWEARMSDDPDVDRWTPRLPRLSGKAGTEIPLWDPHERTIRFFADVSGALRRNLQDIPREEQLEFLIPYAESLRDMENPAQQSRTQTFLFLDRDMAGRQFRELLLLLTDLEVRMRRVFLVAQFENTPAYQGQDRTCLSLDLYPVHYPTQFRIRIQETAVDLVLRNRAESESGPTLTAALIALPEEARKNGILLRSGPGVPVERLMQLLHVLAQQEKLRVVLDLREEGVPESTSGLTLDGRPVRLIEPIGEVKTDLRLEVWR